MRTSRSPRRWCRSSHRRFGSSHRTVQLAQRCFCSTERGGPVISSLVQVSSSAVQVRRAALPMRCAVCQVSSSLVQVVSSRVHVISSSGHVISSSGHVIASRGHVIASRGRVVSPCGEVRASLCAVERAAERHGWRGEQQLEQGGTAPSLRHHHVRAHGGARDSQHTDDRLRGRVVFADHDVHPPDMRGSEASIPARKSRVHLPRRQDPATSTRACVRCQPSRLQRNPRLSQQLRAVGSLM